MDISYLAIENDCAVHARESSYWAARNISSVRVTSMREGIKAAAQNQFLYIGINATNVDYIPNLSLLREVTHAPIFISTTMYSTQEQGIALSLGADLFGQISENPTDNFISVMASIHRVNEHARWREAPVKLLLSDNILISPTHRRVYVGDVEVKLTTIDFDILFFFMTNRGRILSAEQIYNYAWKYKDDESVTNAVKSAIKRLRKKITGWDNDDGFIENVRGVGYRFRVPYE